MKDLGEKEKNKKNINSLDNVLNNISTVEKNGRRDDERTAFNHILLDTACNSGIYFCHR